MVIAAVVVAILTEVDVMERQVAPCPSKIFPFLQTSRSMPTGSAEGVLLIRGYLET